MFTSEDFELPLEVQLKLRVVYDDIDKADDIAALKDNLKHLTKLLVQYQHLIKNLLMKQLESESSNILKQIDVSDDGKINIVDTDS
tara:strand:+ start:718 stop:975 length:258 start_codon:yes stop_codon:yes gene_type:complete